MSPLVIFGMFLIIFLDDKQIHAVGELYGQSSGRIKISSNNQDFLKPQNDFLKQYQSSSFYGRSPTFSQSRRYHIDPIARNNRPFRRPSLYQSHVFSSAYPTYKGTGIQAAAPNQEGCRLTDNSCSRDYQCCSGKCRCVRWSVMGKMSCWKKCF